MRIGIARETALQEERVILCPREVNELVRRGHTVMVEKGAGAGVFFSDQDYLDAGSFIVEDRYALYGDADILVKLKAPTVEEFGMLRRNVLFSMLHHHQNPVHIYHLGRRGAVAVEMELIKNTAGERLVDATDITGELGVLYALRHLKKLPSEMSALVLGYGRVASGAIRICNQLGMQLKILRREEYAHIRHFLKGRDLLINALAWPEPERRARLYVVRRDMLRLMNPGAVVLDLSVDFPSPVETSMPTSLSRPWYIEEGLVHIAIYGYPGLVPVSSCERYSRQVLPLVLLIADNGGLAGIAERGDMGWSLAQAVVDPRSYDWELFAPRDTRSDCVDPREMTPMIRLAA